MLFLAILAALGLLAIGGGPKREADDLPLADLVDAAIEGGLTAAEAESLASRLQAAGEKELAARLRKSAQAEPAAPATPTKREQALAILAVIRDWRALGSDDQACIALDPELVKAVQRTFGLEQSGRWNAQTAIAAQGVLSEAPAACDLSDLMGDGDADELAQPPAQWVRP